MGTYTKIALKNKKHAKMVNTILKKEYGLTYQTFNGVEYGCFVTQEMENEDIRYMNEDEEGLKQMPHFKRPINKRTYRSLTKYCKEVGAFIVKINSPLDEQLQQIEVLQKFLNTEYAKQYIDYKKSKNIPDLIGFNIKRWKELNL